MEAAFTTRSFWLSSWLLQDDDDDAGTEVSSDNFTCLGL